MHFNAKVCVFSLSFFIVISREFSFIKPTNSLPTAYWTTIIESFVLTVIIAVENQQQHNKIQQYNNKIHAVLHLSACEN